MYSYIKELDVGHQYYLLEDYQETLGWWISPRHFCQFFCEIGPSANAEVVQYQEETGLTAIYVPEAEKLVSNLQKEFNTTNRKYISYDFALAIVLHRVFSDRKF